MSRWQPDASGRLAQAALELYAGRGFENTTVAEIAERAGLTERTFFRHFADKREVLFRGSEQLSDQLAEATIGAPAGLPALDAVELAVIALSPFFDERRSWSEQRRAVIRSSRDLQERELIKRAALVAAFTGALRERGESERAAILAAELGVTAFHIAYDRWADDPAQRSYAVHARETMAELRVTCGAPGPAANEPAAGDQASPVATGRV